MIGARFKSGVTHADVLLLGLEPENLKRLGEGKPMHLKHETHEMVPVGLELLIFSGSSTAAMLDELRRFGEVDVIDQREDKAMAELLPPQKAHDFLQALETVRETIGATGEYPEGKNGPDDQGQLRTVIISHHGQIRLEFGKPVAWLSLPPQDAIALGQLLIGRAKAMMETKP